MRFLLPIGGVVDHRFGIMTYPGHWGISAGIKAGMDWAADNHAFTKSFDPDEYATWLDKMLPYRATCLFVIIPDRVGDAAETLRLFEYWRGHPMFDGWPVAFAAQDEQEALDFPPADQWQALFVGGSTAWKLSTAAEDCINRARSLGKRIHIGRVNYGRRYRHFASMEGSNDWTCDGTRTRYERDKAIVDWARYMAAPRQPRLFVSGSSGGGEPADG